LEATARAPSTQRRTRGGASRSTGGPALNADWISPNADGISPSASPFFQTLWRCRLRQDGRRPQREG
jgi:hypothetical protein